jgi:ribosomal protein S18 acetylase RimI-like enzyme
METENGDIVIRIVSEWDPSEIVALYKEGGWWKEDYDPSGIPDLVRGSFLFAVAIHSSGGPAVGMGRVISDGVSDGYIQDVVVSGSLRRNGIGSSIVRELANKAMDAGLVWIGLIAEEGTSHFYKGLGFDLLPGTPMIFKGGGRTDRAQ